MDLYGSTCGRAIPFSDSLDQLITEHVLQKHRDVWEVLPFSPYLAINYEQLARRKAEVVDFELFTSTRALQNLRGQDIATRFLGVFGGGGTNAGFGSNGQILVEGKANALAHTFFNFNHPLAVGGNPWCALNTNLVCMDSRGTYQYKFGELGECSGRSITVSDNFDFTELTRLQNRYFDEYLNPPQGATPCPVALSKLLDEIFVQNLLSLAAAKAYHREVSPSLVSLDYEAPKLTKYDRHTHGAGGTPKVEVVFALLHYEKALFEFDELKKHHAINDMDRAFLHSVYCVVAIAACMEAVANKLIFICSGVHALPRDNRPALVKINGSCPKILAKSGGEFRLLLERDPEYEAMETVRNLRNSFMHGKESEHDLDSDALTSTLFSKVSEEACRYYLKKLRETVDRIYSQMPDLVAPIVTKEGGRWLGDLEVP